MYSGPYVTCSLACTVDTILQSHTRLMHITLKCEIEGTPGAEVFLTRNRIVASMQDLVGMVRFSGYSLR